MFMVPISPVPAFVLLYFYVSTFRSMCSVPNMAVFGYYYCYYYYYYYYYSPLGTVRPIYRTATLRYHLDVAFYIFFQQI
jgi:hypothetical protein